VQCSFDVRFLCVYNLKCVVVTDQLSFSVKDLNTEKKHEVKQNHDLVTRLKERAKSKERKNEQMLECWKIQKE
jgi:hypothetical protein